MKKVVLLSIGLALLLLTSCGAEKLPQESQNTELTPHTQQESSHSESSKENLPGKTEQVKTFDAIEVDVLAADIRVEVGDDWSVSYYLSDKEPVKQLGVEGDTLYVETAFDPTEYYDRTEDWFVLVTVPADTDLADLELETISGNVGIQDIVCDTAQLSSISGRVKVQNVDARVLDLETASGKIDVDDATAKRLEAETVSGNLDISGVFEDVNSNTISGRTQYTGSITIEGSIESVSGDVSLTLDHPAEIEAKSMETITVNGERSKGTVHTGEGIPITIESISSRIDIETA